MQHKYPILEQKVGGKRLIYFDAACTYLRSAGFIDDSSRYYNTYSSCAGDRESSYLGSHLSQEIEDTRKYIRQFLAGAPEDCIVFTGSTTDGINMLAHGLSESIKTYLVSDLEHNSNYLPWRESARSSNIGFKVIPYKDIFDPVELERFLETVQKPFLLSITHASNIIGGVFDMAVVAHIVHNAGGYICVDDAQYVVHHQENVGTNDIDFLVFSGHKVGGPTGIGVLYIQHKAMHLITRSIRYGGGTLKRIGEESIPEYKVLPYLLEGGVQNFAGILGLRYALEELQYSQDRTEYVQGLTDYFHQKFIFNGLVKYMDIVSLPDGNIVTIRPKTFHAIDFHQYCNYFLTENLIVFRTGTVCADMYVRRYLSDEKNIMRFSFGVYNSKEEIDILFSTIHQYLGS